MKCLRVMANILGKDISYETQRFLTKEIIFPEHQF